MEYSAFDVTSVSEFPPEAQGTGRKEGGENVRGGGSGIAMRKEGFSDPAGQLCIRTHKNCDSMHRTSSSRQTK